jgi:hypothetical protein
MSFEYIKHILKESEDIILRVGLIIGLVLFVIQYVLKKWAELSSANSKDK